MGFWNKLTSILLHIFEGGTVTKKTSTVGRRTISPFRFTLPKYTIDWKEPTYVFGYGSLMYPSGLNDIKRNMQHKYDWSELNICELKGYKRSMCANYGETWVAYYGIRPILHARTNGVLFKVYSLRDYEGLLTSEYAHPLSSYYFGLKQVYTPTDVTTSIEGFRVPEGARVIAFVVPKIMKDGRPLVSYVEKVWNGIQPWGDVFVNRFLETGGLKYDVRFLQNHFEETKFSSLRKKRALVKSKEK